MNGIQKFFRFWTEDRGLLFLLISISILIFIIYPLVGNSNLSATITNTLLIVVLFSGLMSVDIAQRNRKILIFFLVTIVIVGKVGEYYEHNFIIQLHIISRIVFLWLLIILIFIKVFGGKPISFFYRIAGSITIYLLIGFIWANMYFIFYQLIPDSFHFEIPINDHQNLMFNFIYFSFVTLTTLGLGDILPLHPFLKSMVILEAILGPLYLAITIGRLVSSHQMNKTN